MEEVQEEIIFYVPPGSPSVLQKRELTEGREKTTALTFHAHKDACLTLQFFTLLHKTLETRFITKLILSEIKIDSFLQNESQMWGQLLRIPRLLSVDLSFNKLGDRALGSISVSLAKNTTLQSLIIPGNADTYDAAIKLAHALEHNRSLTLLNYATNHLFVPEHNRDKGARVESGLKMLCEKLSKNPILKVLILDNNDVVGTDCLTDLCQCVNLNILSLRDNANLDQNEKSQGYLSTKLSNTVIFFGTHKEINP